jgi:hypothetical protein
MNRTKITPQNVTYAAYKLMVWLRPKLPLRTLLELQKTFSTIADLRNADEPRLFMFRMIEGIALESVHGHYYALPSLTKEEELQEILYDDYPHVENRFFACGEGIDGEWEESYQSDQIFLSDEDLKMLSREDTIEKVVDIAEHIEKKASGYFKKIIKGMMK